MIHDPSCDCDAYACQLRNKGVQISPAATPTSHNRKPQKNDRFNNWEKGIASEPRPHGTRMPFLDQNGSTIPVKKFSEMTKERSAHAARRRAGTTNGE